MTHGRLVGRCCQTEPVLLLTAMKAAGVWLVTVYKSWIKTSLKSGPGSSTQTGICRRRGTGPEIAVRKCTLGKRENWPYKCWCREVKKALRNMEFREKMGGKMIDNLPLFEGEE